MLQCAYILTLTILLAGCKGEDSPLTPIPNNPSELTAHPDSGVIGYPIRLTGMTFQPTHFQNLIKFAGTNDSFRADSGTITEIYTYVPLEAQTGMITVEHSEGVGIVKTFKVAQEWSGGIAVLPFNLPGSVTEAESQRYDDGLRRFIGWTAKVSHDTVVLTNSVLITENRYTWELVFIQVGNGQLPVLVQAISRINYDTGGSTTTLLDAGMIKIDSWNLQGVVSGRVFGRLWGPFMKFSFWYSFQ